MNTKLYLIMLFILVSTFSIYGQDFESDEEIKDMKARVANVSHTMYQNNYTSDTDFIEDTYIQLNISIEVWNPFNKELTSYGSSSCRWTVILETDFDVDIEIEYLGQICTADLAPRIYPSGLSMEQVNPELVIVGKSIGVIPNGNIVINDYNGEYSNSTDNFFGANVTISNGNLIADYEQIPANWGDILYLSSPLDYDGVFILPTLILFGYIKKRKS